MPPELDQQGKLDRLMRHYAPSETTLMAYTKFFEEKIYPPLKIAFPSDFPLLLLHPEFRSQTERGRLFVRELSHINSPRALFRLPLDHHGSGLISIVAIVLSIAVLQELHRQEFENKPLVIIVEEPEVHLHPKAQRTLLNYFKWTSKRHQILITTHSPVFVDRIQPENVVVLKRATKRDAKSLKSLKSVEVGTTLAISGDHAANWLEIKQSLGIRLSDVLMAGEVNLLVEGATEAILIPAMAEASDKIENFDRVFIVNGDGGNLPHIASVLQGFGNPTGVIVDNDRAGRQVNKELANRDPPLDFIGMPEIKTLPSPFNQLQECEIEDILDGEKLLEAFNEAFSGVPGFEFLPLGYDEFSQTQLRLFSKNKPFGWVYTAGYLIGEKTTSAKLKAKPTSARFSKRLLAEAVARRVRAREFPIPRFYDQLFVRINNLLVG
jgi:predicted ATP-dependent endonuclease of OLD family